MNKLVPIFLSAVILILVVGAASAQVDGLATFAETTCDGSEVDVQVTLTVHDVIPPEFTGWIVEREVVGSCEPRVDVGSVQTMPTVIGSHDSVVHDAPPSSGRAIYYVMAVDSGGGRHVIGWPRRTHFAQAGCASSVAARGLVVDDPWYGPYLEVCPDECWWMLSHFDPIYPPDQDLPPPGTLVDIHGELFSGMEGPYIRATHWEFSSVGCLGVPADERSWGSLKAQYR